MPLETAGDILGLNDRSAPHLFTVKAWGKEVYLRDPSMADRASWEAYVQENKGQLTDAAAGVLAQIFLCNSKGDRLFTVADIPRLNEKGQRGMLEIFKKCIELLAIDEDQVEKMEGNSGASH